MGLIGYGMSGARFHAPLIQFTSGLILHKIVSSNQEKVRQDLPDVAVVPDVKDLLADESIDIIVISSPNTTHFTYAKQALLAGKHVVVEKPFVIHTAQADELIALAAKKNLLVSVFHNRRWDNDFLTVKKCIQEGLLGDLYTYEAHFDRFRPELTGKWKEKPLEGSGVFYDLGSHLIDQALHLFGMPQTVWGEIIAQRPGAQIDDYFHIVLGYGRMRVILGAGCVVRKTGPRFQVHGNQGSLIKYGFDSQEGDLQKGKRPGHPAWGEDKEEGYSELTLGKDITVETRIKSERGCYQAYYQGIYQAVVQGTPLPVTATEARNTIAVIETALASHREQRVITLQN